MTCESFMTQCINIPTRKSNILDLCFSNDKNLIHDIDTIENIITSDHSSIIMETDIGALYNGDTSQKENVNIYYTSIPEYDTLFKYKAKAFKILRKSTSATRILNVRRKIMSIELQLEQHYNN